MNFIRAVGLWCIALIFTAKAYSAEPHEMPPKIAYDFLSNTYRGKNSTSMYNMMSNRYKEENDFSAFQTQLRPHHKAALGSHLRIKLISEAFLSVDKGLLYYLTKMDPPFFSFGKKYFIVEKILVVRNGIEWRLQKIPEMMFIFQDYSKMKKDEIMKVFQVLNIDRRKLILEASKDDSIIRTLSEANRHTFMKEYRKALIAYEKVLKLDRGNEEAQKGFAFCQKQLSE